MVVIVGMVRREESSVSGISMWVAAAPSAKLLMGVLERGGACVGATVEVFVLGFILSAR